MTRRAESQYESKIAYLTELDRVYGWDFLEKPIDELTRAEKTAITREYNIARLANSTPELARTKNKTESDYVEMLSMVRPFTGDKFSAKKGYTLREIGKLKPAQKREISRYFESLSYVAARGSMVWYNSSNKKAVDLAREITGERFEGLPGVRGAFVSAETMGQQVHIHVDTKARRLVLQTSQRETISIRWADYGITPQMLADDPIGATQRVTSLTQMQNYTIQAGEHQIGRGVKASFTPTVLGRYIRELTSKYGADKYDEDDPNSHWFGNWMNGLYGHNFATDRDRDLMKRAERKKVEARRQAKRTARRRLRGRKK